MSGRLGGGKINVTNWPRLDRLVVHKLASMDEAKAQYLARFKLRPWVRRWSEGAVAYTEIANRIITGDESRMASIMERADALIDEVIIEDSRLAHKHGWVLAEDGMDACPALVSCGEERAYLDRRRIRMADAATVEPVRVVISTDSKHVTEDHAVAFIAAAKLAQQFRPLEIWWQGSWLNEESSSVALKGTGHVFLVPLVQGDMDFSRLQFVLSDTDRDHVSFGIMASYAYPNKQCWGGGVGKWSSLEDTFDFIPESGIRCDAYRVATYAARWAGLEPRYRVQVDSYAASQSWSPEDKSIQVETPEQKAKRERDYDHQCRQWELDEQRKASERMAELA